MNNRFTWLLGGAIVLLLLIYFIKIPVIVGVIDEKRFVFPKKSFQIHWIHSVEKERWDEFFERQGNELILTKTILNTFGAGTPSEGEVLKTDDHRVHMEINRPMESLNLIISENVQTTIVIDGKEIPLHEHFDHFSEINIFVDNIHLLDYLREERFNERINKQ